MEITYKISKQEMIEILSNKLGKPIIDIISDTNGNFIAKSDTETNIIKQNLIQKFGTEKTENILNFFEELFHDLKETKDLENPDRIIFYKDNESSKTIWMEEDIKKKRLWCRWNDLWSFFENEMNLNFSEIQYVMKTMVEQHTEREIGRPLYGCKSKDWWVEHYTEQKSGN